ncbi:response regulator transcription factor [Fundicoccus culcitae]|uniref:Response regulator transcription factor n=1 Tax=Fundicoccus culcitae TaxID=2969821 RepID=A0ABY5P3F2_9LACT|nr:response regulator transcription factor [Fundicoccus culcitae]UUX33136.1 response regulator transcription factor [Fundicoccus culcitae]
MEYHILCIEDDALISQYIADSLEKVGYVVTIAHDGETAMNLFDSQTFHLVLLDMMLPKKSGQECLIEIRKKSDVPIIVISALNDELIQISAFNQKVDDYVVKPFSITILEHKINAVLRRVYQVAPKIIETPNLKLIPENYELYYQDSLVDLTAKEFEIVHLMVSHPGRVFSREEILTILWGYDYFGDVRNIDVHIKNIRKKIYPELIKTVKSIGYKIGKENL